jgi:hypothetical protein
MEILVLDGISMDSICDIVRQYSDRNKEFVD